MWRNDQNSFKRGGFTLVEVLVALMVLSVGILGLLGALLLSSNVSARSEHLDKAVDLANSILQQTICVTADHLQAQQGQEDRYSYAMSLEDRSGGLMSAKITVQWLEGGSVEQYSLSRVFVPAAASAQQEDE